MKKVIKPATICIILSIVVQFQWSIRQLDFKNAFLHEYLKEVIYMVQPHKFIDLENPHHVCKPHKSIYDLKQAPWAWFKRFTSHLKTLRLHASTANSSLLIHRNDHSITLFLLHVENIILTGNDSSLQV